MRWSGQPTSYASEDEVAGFYAERPPPRPAQGRSIIGELIDEAMLEFQSLEGSVDEVERA